MMTLRLDYSSQILATDGIVTLYPHAFTLKEADLAFARLRDEIHWRQDTIRLYGKSHLIPRLHAWYSDASKTYSYSNIQLPAHLWTDTLLEIKECADRLADTQFNGALLNYYRHGQDSMGWHSDNEPELGVNPIIASVSFGATRSFQFRHKTNPQLRAKVDLTHGSLLVMAGATQHHWVHQIPKTTRMIGERINLTFRVIR